MSSLQQFVRARAASPQHAQNGQPINSTRQAIAANAKIPMKKGPTTHQTSQTQVLPEIPSRGLGNARNSSVPLRHASRRHQTVPDNKGDPYDTDAESIDTTMNQSVIQVEDSQAKDSQNQQRIEVVDFGSEDIDDDEDEFEDEVDEHGGDDADADADADAESHYGLTQEQANYLIQEGLTHLDEEQALEYLSRVRPEGFRTIEGDSYPSTTDGGPTELDDDHVSPSPLRQVFNGNRSLAPPSMPRGSHGGDTGRAVQQSNKLFKQGAELRVQQRVNVQRSQQLDQGLITMADPMQSSQPPSYSQANLEAAPSQSLKTHIRPHHQLAFVPPQHQFPQQYSAPVPGLVSASNPREVPAPTTHPSLTRKKVNPVIRHPSPSEEAPTQDTTMPSYGDYDPKVLATMSYDQLKNQSFDNNPRMTEHPLSEDMQQKPLIERLEHVQKNLDPTKQSAFFCTLRTEEWEDAGDWFLDQFSSIIQRTKQARQQKRKLAQEFEDEVEKRYKHVSKKQHQVADAMKKMQTQGEGLVPRSPRPSKSPRPKKR